MALKVSESEQRAIWTSLKAGFIYVLIPFFLLIAVKLFYEDNWRAIFLAADWSLASCILLGQVSANLTKAVAERVGRVRPEELSYYLAKRFLGVVVALVTYVFMLVEPNIILGSFQVFLFLFACFLYFRDGVATALLKKT